MERSYEELNQILAHLFNDIIKVEEKALAKGPYGELTMTDMHTIEAIGFNTSRNMSAIAKVLGITVGTLTIAINHLVKKGYVERIRSSKDRRVVLVSLTATGRDAFRYYVAFHERMVNEVMSHMEEEEARVLVKALKLVEKFFQQEKKRLEKKNEKDTR